MRKIFRAAAWGASALLVLALVAGGALYIASQRRLDRTWTVAGHALTVPTDSLAVVRGQHVARAISKCIDCHREDLGGGQFIDVPLMARLYASNLTRGKGGVGGTYTDLDWERAIRHGVRRDGTSLLFMPALEFQFLNDDDLGALIAYLKSLPPVDRARKPNSVGPIGRALMLKGDLALIPAERIDHLHHAAAVPMSVSAEYGHYLSEVGGCTGCHGDHLSGGHIPGTPPDWKAAANLTPTGIGHYTEEDFFRALREGIRPPGTPLDSLMPFRNTKHMTDDEIRSLWLFLRTVPARAYGGR